MQQTKAKPSKYLSYLGYVLQVVPWMLGSVELSLAAQREPIKHLLVTLVSGAISRTYPDFKHSNVSGINLPVLGFAANHLLLKWSQSPRDMKSEIVYA